MTNPIEEIKNRLDIVEVISSYIALSQTGANHRARCPFHNEKTPSFMVSKEKQIWHCFGCDKGGDVIAFVQEYEGLSFGEALRVLASKAGVHLDYQQFDKKVDYSLLYQANQLAADFYQQKLWKEEEVGQKTRKYLLERGVSIDSIKKWQLGLSGSGWDELYLHLKERGLSDDHVFQAGLTLRKKSGVGFVDRFRQRLMFPISDSQGRVVAFTSRTLANIVFPEEDLGGKYINSPQTAIYDKGRVLYGWSLAREAIRQKKYLIIVEGNMDAIMSHQAGTANTVAVSGTALTLEHLKLIKRYTNNMVLAFDGDAAGSRAAFRSFALGWQADMNLKILVLPPGQDPAEMVRQNHSDWLTALKNAVPVMDYYLRRIIAGVDLTRADHKKIAVAKLLPIIKFLKSRVEQTHYLQLLSEKLNIPLDVLSADLVHSKAFIDQAEISAKDKPQGEKTKKESFLILSEKLLSVAFLDKVYLEKIINDIEPEQLAESLQSLYRKAVIYYTKNQHLHNFQDWPELTPVEKNDWIYLVMLGQRDYTDYSDKDLLSDFSNLIKRLKLHYWGEQRDRLIAQMRQAELSGDSARSDILSHQINLLNKDINKLHAS